MNSISIQKQTSNLNTVEYFWRWVADHEVALFDSLDRIVGYTTESPEEIIKQLNDMIVSKKSYKDDPDSLAVELVDEMETVFYNLDESITSKMKLVVGEIEASGKRQLILTALGDPEGMLHVSDVIKTKPILSKFEILGYKPRRECGDYSSYGINVVFPEDIRYELIGGKYRLDIHIVMMDKEKYSESCTHEEIIEFIIDCIGEYEYSRDINKVLVSLVDEPEFLEKKSIDRLQLDYDVVISRSYIIN